MAEAAVYSLVQIKYDTSVIPFESATVNPAIMQMLNTGGVSISPTIAALMKSAPIISFDTPAISTAHGVFGQMFPIATDKTVVLYFAKRTTGSTYASGTTAITLTVNEGAVFLMGASAAQDGTAKLNYAVYCIYDGTNLPFTYGTASVPTDSILTEKYTLGQFKISSLYPCISVNYNAGLSIDHRGVGGSPYPTIAAAMRFSPVITIQSLDLTLINTVTTIGKEVDNLTLFFQLFSSSIARATGSVHTSMLFAKAFIACTNLPANNQSDAVVTLTAWPRYDGSNAICQISTSAAIA